MGTAALPSLQQKLAEGQALDLMLAFAVIETCAWERKEFVGGGEQALAERVLRKLRQK